MFRIFVLILDEMKFKLLLRKPFHTSIAPLQVRLVRVNYWNLFEPLEGFGLKKKN